MTRWLIPLAAFVAGVVIDGDTNTSTLAVTTACTMCLFAGYLFGRIREHSRMLDVLAELERQRERT
jgi:hypothetical protein